MDSGDVSLVVEWFAKPIVSRTPCFSSSRPARSLNPPFHLAARRQLLVLLCHRRRPRSQYVATSCGPFRSKRADSLLAVVAYAQRFGKSDRLAFRLLVGAFTVLLLADTANECSWTMRYTVQAQLDPSILFLLPPQFIVYSAVCVCSPPPTLDGCMRASPRSETSS